MRQKSTLKIATCILFFVFLAVGFSVAARKPLWVDELLTQYSSVQSAHPLEILVRGAPGEGNNAPLFYLVQKWVNYIPGAQISSSVYEDGICADLKSQLILRVSPVVFISAALCLLFYFFASEFAVWTGIYALLCALASPMIWLYWAEARPYPLVLFLTVLQSIILILMFRKDPEQRGRLWFWLALVHLLLALTSYLTAIQIIAAALMLLFLCKERSWKKLVVILFVPLLIVYFYRQQGVHHPYRLWFTWKYVLDNFPLDRWAFFFWAGIVFLYSFLKREIIFSEQKDLSRYLFLLFSVIVGISCIFVLVKSGETPSSDLMGLHSRFFIFLTPIGIVAQVLLMWALVKQSSKDVWIRMNLFAIILLLSIIAFFSTSLQVLSGLKLL